METIYNEPGQGRVKVFFVIKENAVKSFKVGNNVVSVDSGVQFYVDDYVAEQIEKFDLYFDGMSPKLKLKDDRLLIVPVENSEYKKKKEIEEMENRLSELKAE